MSKHFDFEGEFYPGSMKGTFRLLGIGQACRFRAETLPWPESVLMQETEKGRFLGSQMEKQNCALEKQLAQSTEFYIRNFKDLQKMQY